MTWGRIAEKFRTTVGESTASMHEQWEHITQGYRVLLQKIDVPEVFVSESTVTVPPDLDNPGEWLDYVDVDPELFAVDSVVNQNTAYPVSPEPSGMPGRDRYLVASASGRPKAQSGEVRYYVRQGTRIYLRNTPDKETKLLIRFRRQAPEVDLSQVNEHPLTPQQYDWAIVYYAAQNYYMNHREANSEIQGMLSSIYYQQQADSIAVGMPHQPTAEEEKASRHVRRLSGYRLTPWSR